MGESKDDNIDIALQVESLQLFYGGIHAVKELSLVVKRGQLTTLIGANGAGKTTTLKGICGLHKPTSGRVLFDGVEITGQPPHLNLRRGLVLCPEGRRIFPDLTVDENLDLGAFTRADRASIATDIAKMHETFPILKERATQRAGTLSGGEQQMLAIARALMSRPKVLMLDEPSLGLAPLIVSRIFKILRELKQQGITILLVEQNARQALDVADYAYVLETGRVIKSGPAAELKHDAHIMQAYLGG